MGRKIYLKKVSVNNQYCEGCYFEQKKCYDLKLEPCGNFYFGYIFKLIKIKEVKYGKTKK